MVCARYVYYTYVKFIFKEKERDSPLYIDMGYFQGLFEERGKIQKVYIALISFIKQIFTQYPLCGHCSRH